MKIGNYTTLENICKSDTAIRHDIDNRPDAIQLHAIKLLAENIYDPLCDHFQMAVPFSSWFRNSIVNSMIGGARRSQHVLGEAVDLDMDLIPKAAITNSVLFYYIFTKLPFDQLIFEYGNDQNPAWVHVSFSANRQRKEVLRIKSRSSGYEPYTP